MIESFILISPTDEMYFNKCVQICYLLTFRKIFSTNVNPRKLIDWLLNGLNFEHNVCCYVLTVLQAIFKYHSDIDLFCLNLLLENDSKLIKYLKNTKIQTPAAECSNSPEKIVTLIVCVLDSLILNSTFNDNLTPLGNILIQLVLSNDINFVQSTHRLNFLAATLSLLNKIAFKYTKWQHKVIGSLLGIGKTYMNEGFHEVPHKIPYKIRVSQQSLVDTSKLYNESKRRVAKTRKLRTVDKIKNTDAIPTFDEITDINCKYIINFIY